MRLGARYAYRFGKNQLNMHGPGVDGEPPIEDAVTHLERVGVDVELGPVGRFGAQGAGTSVYFRDPDGSLLEFISYT